MAELSTEQVTQCLSQAGTTLDGTGVAYLKLNLAAKGVSGFGTALNHLQHVRVINAAGNGLKAITASSVSGCRSLVTLSLAHNRIRRLDDLSQLRNLQVSSCMIQNGGMTKSQYNVTFLHLVVPCVAES